MLSQGKEVGRGRAEKIKRLIADGQAVEEGEETFAPDFRMR
jgi:hypothetical protein